LRGCPGRRLRACSRRNAAACGCERGRGSPRLRQPARPCADSRQRRGEPGVRKQTRRCLRASHALAVGGRVALSDRVDTSRTALGAPNVQFPGLEVDIIPTQGHELAGSQAVAVGDQDGRGVPMAPAVFPRSSVRYSRGRTGRPTVTFTAIGACIPGAVFSIVSRNVGLETVTVLDRSVTVLI
jgi:hypothetical protein